ncbi:AMP-binding protein [Baekduia soli]|uniref:AMP-binding protein n=1 Tax=Baekduia soli TaxID=496014 RepID=A0A5B8UCK2_9ACTN|nr:AMP-binding protein [Baekduia soli]QEC50737.1 AMP-binding protein [Baekduia soli]
MTDARTHLDPATPTLDAMGERTITDLLEEQAGQFGDRTLIVFEDRTGAITELSYAEVRDRAHRCAAGLAARGVGRGDYVVVHLRNCPELLVAWFGMARLGAVFVPSNVANTASEIGHIIATTGARRAITEPDLVEPVEQAVADAGGGLEILVARGAAGSHARFEDLLETGGPVPDDQARSMDVCELIFTSGTTRKPKAVMLTHANCLRAGLDSVHCLWLTPGERCLTALPMFHVNAQAFNLFGNLTVGGTLILLEEFRASKFMRQVREHEATQTCLVAMQLRTLIAQPVDPAERDHKVRRLFFAINVTDEEKDAFEERFGIELINGYGLSEAMTLLACSPIAGPRRWPSIGLPSPGRRLLLLDDEGREVAQGEVGEIVVEGTPGRDIMLGYLNDEEATAAALHGRLLHTGDNAYADEKGYLYFFDRKKDMIKRAGENVSAIEVESTLLEHPQIAEAAVVGVPDDIRDEAVAAVVVPTEPGVLSEQEVIDYCREHLSKFKVPTLVTFATQLPRTSIGKIRKDELRKELTGAPAPPPAG